MELESKRRGPNLAVNAKEEKKEIQQVAKFLLNHPKFIEKYLLNVEPGKISSLDNIKRRMEELCKSPIEGDQNNSFPSCELVITADTEDRATGMNAISIPFNFDPDPYCKRT